MPFLSVCVNRVSLFEKFPIAQFPMPKATFIEAYV